MVYYAADKMTHLSTVNCIFTDLWDIYKWYSANIHPSHTDNSPLNSSANIIATIQVYISYLHYMYIITSYRLDNTYYFTTKWQCQSEIHSEMKWMKGMCN